MNLVDFLIGLTLMNAMPHLVLGVWKGRMFSAFGFGNWKNIAYGSLNLVVSIGLFVYRHGLGQVAQDGIYAGALTILVIYFLTARFWYYVFHERIQASRQPSGTR